MANVPLRFIAYRWDHLTPLLTGEIVPEGIDLTFDRTVLLPTLFADPSYDGGESSLGLYMQRFARGDRDWVGMPIFPMHQFRHRCFLTRRGVSIENLKELEGKKVGIDGWPNTGNTWTRILLREAGVDIWKIEWVLAPVEAGASSMRVFERVHDNVTVAPAGKSLIGMTADGEIDAMVTAFLPPAFFAPDFPLVHMIPDYRAAEQAYFKRVGYAPAHHIIVVKRSIAEQHPWIARSLLAAFTAARKSWIADRRKLQDTGLWLLPDLEETASLFGEGWPNFGLEPNLKMLTDFCQDQYHQKLVDAPVDPVEAFAAFTEMMQS